MTSISTDRTTNRPPGSLPGRVARTSAAVLAVLVVLQAGLAGGALEGQADLTTIHGTVGLTLIFGLSLTAMIAAARARRHGDSGVPVALCVFGFLAVIPQLGLGYARVLAAHFPLGVTIGLIYAAAALRNGRQTPGVSS